MQWCEPNTCKRQNNSFHLSLGFYAHFLASYVSRTHFHASYVSRNSRTEKRFSKSMSKNWTSEGCLLEVKKLPTIFTSKTHFPENQKSWPKAL